MYKYNYKEYIYTTDISYMWLPLPFQRTRQEIAKVIFSQYPLVIKVK